MARFLGTVPPQRPCLNRAAGELIPGRNTCELTRGRRSRGRKAEFSKKRSVGFGSVLAFTKLLHESDVHSALGPWAPVPGRNLQKSTSVHTVMCRDDL